MRKVIKGNVNLYELNLIELFDLSDVEVRGWFDCTYNHLTNLEGSPHTVVGDYICNNSRLTSLEGGPHTVGGDYNCSYNNLSNLIGAPQTVGGGFFCTYNRLNSLEGIPKTIVGGFYIDTVLRDKFPKEYIRSLSKIGGVIGYL